MARRTLSADAITHQMRVYGATLVRVVRAIPGVQHAPYWILRRGRGQAVLTLDPADVGELIAQGMIRRSYALGASRLPEPGREIWELTP